MKTRAFTLVEIMIVILIIGVLLAVAVPQWIKARTSSQLRSCHSNIRAITGAKEQFAMENHLPNGSVVVAADLFPAYIKGVAFPACPQSGVYTIGLVGDPTSCSIHGVLP